MTICALAHAYDLNNIASAQLNRLFRYVSDIHVSVVDRVDCSSCDTTQQRRETDQQHLRQQVKHLRVLSVASASKLTDLSIQIVNEDMLPSASSGGSNP